MGREFERNLMLSSTKVMKSTHKCLGVMSGLKRKKKKEKLWTNDPNITEEKRILIFGIALST